MHVLADIIRVGDKIDLTLSGKKSDSEIRTYKSKIFDIIDDTTIKIGMPIENGSLVLLHQDVRYDMFFYTSKGLYECKGTVTERYKDNNMYVAIIEFITPLKKNQRREYFRLNCTMDLKYLTITEEEKDLDSIDDILEQREEKLLSWNEGFILDISGGGLRFSTDRYIEEQSYLYSQFSIIVNGISTEITALSYVISSEKNLNKSNVYESRVKFINLGRSETEKIVRFIFEEERKSRKHGKS